MACFILIYDSEVAESAWTATSQAYVQCDPVNEEGLHVQIYNKKGTRYEKCKKKQQCSLGHNTNETWMPLTVAVLGVYTYSLAALICHLRIDFSFPKELLPQTLLQIDIIGLAQCC